MFPGYGNKYVDRRERQQNAMLYGRNFVGYDNLRLPPLIRVRDVEKQEDGHEEFGQRREGDLTMDGVQQYEGYKYFYNFDSKYAQTGIGSLASLAFVVFVIYALATANKGEVNDACGSSLWNFMLSRLVLAFSEFTLIWIIGFFQIYALTMSSSNTKSTSICCGLMGGLMLIGLHATFVGVGFTITKKAMDDGICNAALSSVSFTKTPLLGILGYVYIGLDCLFLFIFTCFGMCAAFVATQV
jgi:hypothetical protein